MKSGEKVICFKREACRALDFLSAKQRFTTLVFMLFLIILDKYNLNLTN